MCSCSECMGVQKQGSKEAHVFSVLEIQTCSLGVRSLFRKFLQVEEKLL